MSDERKFDPAWPYGHVTRDGRKARILATDLKGAESIVAVVEEYSGRETIRKFFPTGTFLAVDGSPNDLFNAPAPKRKMWVNLYPEGLTSVWHWYETREMADYHTAPYRIACVEVEIPEDKQ